MINSQSGSEPQSEAAKFAVKKYAAGQSIAWMVGSSQHATAAAESLLRSFTTTSVIVHDRFRELMRERNVPEDVVEQYLRSAWIDDEAYLTDRP